MGLGLFPKLCGCQLACVQEEARVLRIGKGVAHRRFARSRPGAQPEKIHGPFAGCAVEEGQEERAEPRWGRGGV
jgi:hypothetical protein